MLKEEEEEIEDPLNKSIYNNNEKSKDYYNYDGEIDPPYNIINTFNRNIYENSVIYFEYNGVIISGRSLNNADINELIYFNDRPHFIINDTNNTINKGEIIGFDLPSFSKYHIKDGIADNTALPGEKVYIKHINR